MTSTKNIPKYQDSAAQKKTLDDVIEGFIADAIERFPFLKGRLLIVDTNKPRSYGAADLDHYAVSLAADETSDYLDRLYAQQIKAVGPGSFAAYDPERRLCSIFYDNHIDETELNNITEDTERKILSTLDHELGHLAIENGYPNSNDLYVRVVGESIADAYALIRHYQRFGADSKLNFNYTNPVYRAHNMMHGDLRHFTTFVTDEIIKCKDQIDFNALSSEETARLAWRFAMNYVPPAPLIESLHNDLKPIRDAFKLSNKDGVKALIDRALHPETGYFNFRVTSRWLRSYLDGEFKFLNGDPGLSKEYLGNVSTELKEREFRLAAEDILFNVPTVSEKPASAPQRRSQPQPV